MIKSSCNYRNSFFSCVKVSDQANKLVKTDFDDECSLLKSCSECLTYVANEMVLRSFYFNFTLQ